MNNSSKEDGNGGHDKSNHVAHPVNGTQKTAENARVNNIPSPSTAASQKVNDHIPPRAPAAAPHHILDGALHSSDSSLTTQNSTFNHGIKVSLDPKSLKMVNEQKKRNMMTTMRRSGQVNDPGIMAVEMRGIAKTIFDEEGIIFILSDMYLEYNQDICEMVLKRKSHRMKKPEGMTDEDYHAPRQAAWELYRRPFYRAINQRRANLGKAFKNAFGSE